MEGPDIKKPIPENEKPAHIEFAEPKPEKEETGHETWAQEPGKYQGSMVNESNLDVQTVPSKAAPEKGFLGKVYEGIYKIPVLNRIVGKMEIAYHNRGIEKNQEEAADLKKDIETYGAEEKKVSALSETTESILKDLQKENLPGTEAILKKLEKLGAEKKEILGKQTEMKAELDKRNAKIGEYEGKRNTIADRLIEYYDTKLTPMNEKIGTLNGLKDQLEFSTVAFEIKHRGELLELDRREKVKNGLVEKLKKIGQDPEKFEAVYELEKEIDRGRVAIKMDQADMALEKKRLEEQIAEINKSADVYKAKRKNFELIKEGKSAEPIALAKENFTEASSASSAQEGAETEKSAEKSSTVASLLLNWNKHIAKKSAEERTKETIIEEKDFVKVLPFGKDYPLNIVDFKKILGQYYKLKKLSLNKKYFESFGEKK